MTNREPVVLSTFEKVIPGKQSRFYGVFECLDCQCRFESRMERLNKMTGLCRACANKYSGRKRSTHGFNNANSRLHVTWANMKRRCLKPTAKEAANYSGVPLCAEWHEFEPFMNWAVENGYTDKSTIDRKDPAKGYSPDNCRFADYSTQSANRRITKKNQSGFIGVSFESGAWRSKITWRGKQIHLGTFNSAEDAAASRDKYIVENKLPHTLSAGDPAKAS